MAGDQADNYCQWQGDNLLLRCQLQPRASEDAFAGPYGNSVKIRITAPPVDGKANAHLIKFLARQFGVPRRDVEILSGESSRSKRVRIRKPKHCPTAIDCGSRGNDQNEP